MPSCFKPHLTGEHETCSGHVARRQTVMCCLSVGHRRLRAPAVAAIFALLCLSMGAQDTGLVSQMAATELAAHRQNLRFSYTSDERSARTNGHLWKERVVETDDGPLRRLIGIDGKPLTPDQARAEADRIEAVTRNPDAFRRENVSHQDDEAHATQLLQLLPKAFLLAPAGEQDGCTRFAFRPNPAFQPSSFEERVVAVMGGTVSLKQPENRLCDLSAKLLQPVEFGFGFLGRVDPGGYFSLMRVPVAEGVWKTDRISVHMQGRVLMMKSLTREQETVRTELKVIPPHLSLTQAAQLSLQ